MSFFHVSGLINLKDFRNDYGETLLHTAFALGADEILQYLINKVKIPNICNSVGETYEFSGRKELEQNVRRAIECGAIKSGFQTTGFYDSASGFRAGTIEECLKHYVNLNVPMNDIGQTLLHLAIEKFPYIDRNIIHLLLDHGADAYIEDHEGVTPLQLALNFIARDHWLSPETISAIEDAKILVKRMQAMR